MIINPLSYKSDIEGSKEDTLLNNPDSFKVIELFGTVISCYKKINF